MKGCGRGMFIRRGLESTMEWGNLDWGRTCSLHRSYTTKHWPLCVFPSLQHLWGDWGRSVQLWNRVIWNLLLLDSVFELLFILVVVLSRGYRTASSWPVKELVRVECSFQTISAPLCLSCWPQLTCNFFCSQLSLGYAPCPLSPTLLGAKQTHLTKMW